MRIRNKITDMIADDLMGSYQNTRDELRVFIFAIRINIIDQIPKRYVNVCLSSHISDKQ